MNTRLPPSPGEHDFHAFIRFLAGYTDKKSEFRKQADQYFERLAKATAEFREAAALYGKGKDIERLNGLAEAWEEKARSEFGTREEKLVAGERALVTETRERRAKLKNREIEIEQVLVKGNHELTRRDVALKASEAEMGKREQAAEQATAKAQEAHEAALEAKRAADGMVQRMKAAAEDKEVTVRE